MQWNTVSVCECMCVSFKDFLEQMLCGLSLWNEEECKHINERSEGSANGGRGMSEEMGLLNCAIKSWIYKQFC